MILRQLSDFLVRIVRNLQHSPVVGKIGFFLVLIWIAFSPEQPWGEEYRMALPGYKFHFPQDHASHEDFKTEWWYYTGHLRDGKGLTWGYQLTFFRMAPENRPKSLSRWAVKNLYFAHFALTDIKKGRFWFSDRISRAGLGLAGAKEDRFQVWIRDWKGEEKNGVFHLQAKEKNISIDLILHPEKHPTIHGKDGIDQKTEGVGHASHYYSISRMKTTGTLTYEENTFAVSGSSWMDHEFGSNQLTRKQVGWDWFSLQLDDGTDLMLYRMRLEDGSYDPYSSGTIIFPQGKSETFSFADTRLKINKQWKSPQSGALYPIGWKLDIPRYKISLELAADVANQELDTTGTTNVIYWEGSISAKGTRQNKPVTGEGYAELTGYAKRFDSGI